MSDVQVKCGIDSEDVIDDGSVALYGGFPRAIVHPGIRRLMVAVLEDAFDLIQKGPRNVRYGQQLFDDANAWVDSHDRGHPFTFERICEALDLDVDYLRRGVARVRAVRTTRRVSVALWAEPPTFVTRQRHRLFG